MSAFNIVRFRVKSGMEENFIEAQKKLGKDYSGFIGGHLIKTGERTFCFIGEWNDFDSIVSNRPKMISNLDSFRDLLEDLGNGLGVTDPVSGESVAEFYATEKTKSQPAGQEMRH
ncbi:MAG: DUF718 domain-containing protein [Pseudobdellovibrionaceae bacterium]